MVLFHHLERPLHFLVELGEICCQGRFLWIKNNVYRYREFRQMKTNRLAHAALDAVALNGSAEGPGNGESDTRTLRFRRDAR